MGRFVLLIWTSPNNQWGQTRLIQLVVKGGKVNWTQVATDTVTNFIQNRAESNAIEKVRLAEAQVQETLGKQKNSSGDMVADVRKHIKTTISDALTPEEEVRYRQIQDSRNKLSEENVNENSGQEFADYWVRKDERLMQSATAYKPSLLDYGVGAAELLFGSTYNLGVITGSGFRGLYYATTEGADAGVNAIQQSQKASYEYRSEGAKAI